MDGIAANGRGWKHRISLGGQTEIMGKMDDDTTDDAVQKCAEAIIARVRTFADRLHKHPDTAALADRLRDEAEALEAVADCGIDEVRWAMSSLYDQFDFSRICVVS